MRQKRERQRKSSMRNYLFALFYVAMLSSCSSCSKKNVTNTGVGDTGVDDTRVYDACINEDYKDYELSDDNSSVPPDIETRYDINMKIVRRVYII